MLSNKAQTLDLLKQIFQNTDIVIPDYFHFSVEEYHTSPNDLVYRVFEFSKSFQTVIVRSSAIDEDQQNKTLAGKYQSITLSQPKNLELKTQLALFVKQFHSPKDRIIVQKQITAVDQAGVVFTQDINSAAPYYLINYDDSGYTNLITAGTANVQKKQLIVYKSHPGPKLFQRLIRLCQQLEQQVGSDRLDIEFAIKQKQVYIFQARYLPKPNSATAHSEDTDEAIRNIVKKIDKMSVQDTVFSNMADWNPAEMIGEKPTPLALSLYKELITDEVWRLQRSNYGYRDVFPAVLMFSYAGSPYVDLRTDLYSFMPAALDDALTQKIVDIYLALIKKQKYLHDKIEFELIETCYSFGSLQRLAQILDSNTAKPYLSALKTLTQNIFVNNFLNTEKAKIKKFDLLLKELQSNGYSAIQNIFHLIKIIKQYGTLPFAGFARMAFICQRLLLDLKEIGLVTEQEYNNFFNSLHLVNDSIAIDFKRLLDKEISQQEFLTQYGHIRPSMYDINSLNYGENFEMYFPKKYIYKKKTPKKNIFANRQQIDDLFTKTYGISFDYFLNFATETITHREQAKFVFSKGLDQIFLNLINLANEIEVSRQDIGFIDIKNILNFFSKLEARKLKKSLVEEIQHNRKELAVTNMIKLPDVIQNSNDILCFEESNNKINFVTNESVTGETVEISLNKNINLNGKIVCIKNADPGYDYIFSYKIKGLITQYGGSNSHMSIRCLELNIPAAIGVGRIKYETVSTAGKVVIDCLKKKLYTLI